MSSHRQTKNISEQLADAREQGEVWSTTKGAKDCIICVLLLCFAEIIGNVQFKFIVDDLLVSVTDYDFRYLAKNSFVYKFFINLFIASISFGLLTLLLVLIQTKGFISFKAIDKTKSRIPDSVVIEIIRAVCAGTFLFLISKEVLPKACALLFQLSSRIEYMPLFQIVLSRAALFFLCIGIIEIVYARSSFLRNLATQKPTD